MRINWDKFDETKYAIDSNLAGNAMTIVGINDRLEMLGEDGDPRLREVLKQELEALYVERETLLKIEAIVGLDLGRTYEIVQEEKKVDPFAALLGPDSPLLKSRRPRRLPPKE